MPDTSERSEIFAVNFAALAREIAMDILPINDILSLHQLDEETWARIQANKNFQDALSGLVQEWNSAANTRERVKIKAATGLESQLETFIGEISDTSIPLVQRVEAGKFLARLGELDAREGGMLEGGGFHIVLNIGTTQHRVDFAPKILEGAIVEDEA